MDGNRDVLERPVADVLEGRLDLAPHLLHHRRRGADAARLRERFQPRGDVDALPEDLVVLDHQIAEMDAHAELQPPVERQIGLAARELGLHADRAGRRVDGARELGEQVVADRVHDSPMMLADESADASRDASAWRRR